MAEPLAGDVELGDRAVQSRVDEMIELVKARRLTPAQVQALNGALFDLSKEQASQAWGELKKMFGGAA